MTTTATPPPTTPPDDPPGPGKPGGGGDSGTQRRIVGATGIMMAGILGSRLLGLVRERVIAHQFGQSFSTDVYNGAFTIPDLLFFLIAGGALSSAFIPVFTEYVTKNKEREAWRIFSVVATVMTLVVMCFIVIGEIFTRQLVEKTNPGFAAIPGKIEATVALTRILLPAQVCFFLGGLMMGSLTARNKFAGQALGPVIYNLGIIFGGLFLTRYFGVAGLCWGAVGGAVVGNLGLQWYLVRKSGGYYLPGSIREHFRHPGVIKVWKLMLPVILGLALPQVSTIIGKIFASTLAGDGPQSALMNANKLMQVPLGIFAQATAIAIFPTMAAQAARKEIAALRQSVNFGIRSILFLTVPSSLLMFVLALPIVQLLLQSGKFTDADAQMAAAALRYFAVGIFAWSAHSIITRGFYALQDSKTPVVVGTLVTLIFVPLNLVSLHYTGRIDTIRATAGLALVTSIAAVIHMSLMLALLRRRLRGLNGGRLLVSVVKILLASAVATVVCRWLRDRIQHGYDVKHAAELAKHVAVQTAAETHRHVTRESFQLLLICLTVSVVVYGGMALLLRMDEIALLRRLLRRGKRLRSSGQ
jgi:putative peptidoglycan lipid II flippase